MSNIWKRSLSFFLAAAMVFGMLPMPSYAAEDDGFDSLEEVFEDERFVENMEFEEMEHSDEESEWESDEDAWEESEDFEDSDLEDLEEEEDTLTLSGDTRKIYFFNAESWETVWAAWSFEEEDFEDEAFPGVELTEDEVLENAYVLELPVEADEVCFSDGLELTEELLAAEADAGLKVTHQITVALDEALDCYDNGWVSYDALVVAPVQALIDALPAEVNSEAECEAVWTAIEAIDGEMAELTEEQQALLNTAQYDAALDAAAAFFNPEEPTTWEAVEPAAEEDEPEAQAEADGWYWSGNTLYIKDGSMTKGKLYAAFNSTFDNNGYEEFKYDSVNRTNWTTNGTKVTPGDTDDTTVSRGNGYAKSRGRLGYSTGGNKWSFTVEYYYIPSVTVTGKDGVAASDVTAKVIHGNSISFTLPAMGEDGWTAAYGGTTTALSASEATTITVENITSASAAVIEVELQNAVPHDIHVTVNSETPWGTASASATSSFAGETITITATPNAVNGGKYSYSVAKIELNGEEIGSSFEMPDGVANIVVTFARSELEVNSELLVKINGYDEDSIMDGLKEKILNAVLKNVEDDVDDYEVSVWLDIGRDLDLVIIKFPTWINLDDSEIINWLSKNIGKYLGGFWIKVGQPLKVQIVDKYGRTVEIDSLPTEDFRDYAAIELDVTEYSENTLSAVISAIKGNVLVNGATVSNLTVELTPDTALREAEQTYTASVTAPATAEYLETTEEFEITAALAKYTVTFKDMEGNVLSQEQYPYGTPADEVELPEPKDVPVIDGHTFNGWTVDAVTTDAIYQASYTINQYTYTVKTFTMDVNGEYGEPVSEKKAAVNYGTDVSVTPKVEPGFALNEEKSTLTGKIPANDDLVLNVYIDRNKYDVIWKWGENESETVSMYYDAPISGYELSEEDESYDAVEDGVTVRYYFSGWNELENGATVPVGGVTYTAKFDKTAVYEVKFDTGKGSTVTSQYVEANKLATEPAEEPKLDGYSFDGWYLDGEVYDFATPVEKDITLTAKWVKLVTVTFEGAEGEAYAPQTFVIGDKAEKPAAPTKDQAIFDGWYLNGTESEEPYNFETPVEKDITLTAKWLDDVNSNGVFDDEETITVRVNKADDADAVAVTGERVVGKALSTADTKSYIFDSTKSVITITATPFVTDDISSTYVKSIGEAKLTYGDNFVATAELTVKNGDEITVTFEKATFTYDEDGQMRFYVGMEDPDYETLYNAVIKTPEYDATEGVITAKYLARPAATYQMQVPVLAEIDLPAWANGLDIDDIVIGGNVVDIDLDDAWLDVGESFKTLTPEELQKQYDEEIQKIKDKVAAIDLSDLSLSNAWDKVKEIWAITDELSVLIDTIKNEAEYLGYHQFGASALKDENGNAQELLQVIYQNEVMRLVNEELYVTLVDDRIETTITAGDLTFEYDEFTDADIMNALVLTDVNGNAVEGQLVKHVDLVGTEVGSRTFSVSYAGSWDHKPCTAEFTLTVVKAPSAVDVLNQNIPYGTTVSAPVITNKHGNAIDIEAIEFILGLDVADLDIDSDGVKGLEGKMQLILPESLQGILALIGLEEGATLNLNDLIELLTNELLSGVLGEWGITSELIDALDGILQTINGITETNNLEITIGGTYPTDIGAYLHGAVTVDGNYETAFDVGYILINPVAERVYLDWNFDAPNGVFTPALLETMNLSATAYAEETFETKVAAATELINNLFFGFDANGEFVAELFNKEITDPEELENKLSNGAYAQMAFVAEFGNEFYYSVPIVRAFVLIPDVFEVRLVGETGTENRELLKTFNNEPQGFSVKVTDQNGKLIYSDHYQTSDVNELQNPVITYNYVGIQTNGQTYQSAEKPVHAGAYAVTVSVEDRDNDGNLLGFGADVGLLIIEPAESNVMVEDKIVKNETVKFRDLVTATSTGTKLTPDTTIITAGIDTNEDINEAGWDAVNGVVNIDFPEWLDALLAEYAPGVQNGITASQLKDKLENKLPDISEKLTELGATKEVINSLANLTENINKVLAEMPENIKLSFNDDAQANDIGAYIVVAVVTDSDHYPSADAGYLVVLPEVSQVELKWNYEDENGIFTRDLLEEVDLLAKAYDVNNGEEVEANITYQFIGINSDNEPVIYTDPATVPNGAYVEVAYVELYIDGQMVISDMIARPVVIVASNCNVKIENVETVFSNEAHEIIVEVTDLNGNKINTANGELTVLYAGLQTNGKPYASTEAPVHAGVYEALVTYIEYVDGELRYYGANAGYVLIDLAASEIDVTGDTVTYDGKGHTAKVEITKGHPYADYTLISGGVSISGDVEKAGVDAFRGNVNIDLPRWLNEALDKYEFTDGIDAAKLADYMDVYRNDLIKAVTVDKLVEWKVITEEQQNAYVEKLNAYIDELIAVLKQMPKDVKLTFVDGITYTEPGAYCYYGIVTDSDHYPSTDTGLLVIEKADVTVTMDDLSKVYGTENDPELTYTVDGLVSGDKLTVVASREKGENVGEYKITAEASHPFYNVTVLPGTLTIKPKDFSDENISWVKALVYNGAEQNVLTAVTMGDKILVEGTDYTVSGNKATDAGTYTMNITGIGNYAGEITVEWTIAPAMIDSAEVTSEYVYNGTEQTVTLVVKAGELVLGADDYKVTGNKNTNAGEYAVEVEAAGNFQGKLSATWRIEAAEIILTVKNNEVLAGTTEIPTVEFEVTNNKGEVKLEELNASAAWDVADKMIEGKLIHGEYENGEVTYTKSENWKVTEIVNGKLTVIIGDYVCWNPESAQYWDDLSDALMVVDDAVTETVQMLQAVKENYVIVAPGTILDLNGLTVETYLISGFKQSHVIDSSEDKAGLLKAPMTENVRLDVSNAQIPAWNGEGYKFYTVDISTNLQRPHEDTDLFRFYVDRTEDWYDLYTLFADNGSEDHDLKLNVKLSYVTAEGVDAGISYKYPSEMIIAAASKQLVGGYSIYKATTTGMIDREQITYSVVLVSGTGAEFEIVH